MAQHKERVLMVCFVRPMGAVEVDFILIFGFKNNLITTGQHAIYQTLSFLKLLKVA